ncbi:uncharacterized protein (DUF924 family) [Halanaerobium saccharolyticum]|uniref:Uncharacterized protein (DUF924 family) n=1 Tax=Halanaerobium saccharolyticum TaxID=43595 RepID=A0A4R6LBX8_9FIRM|nr:DUF924 family protein [Halanaerobium saccharolyticum]TDO73408.1 uncharacterized protein (DUF924 family) [Halanaerobium saccharolyticum]
MNVKASEVIKFWFEELTPKQWFVSSEELDTRIYKRFGVIHDAATKGELDYWRATPEGSLAEIIVLDQFSRNIYREKPEAFANDLAALILAQEAIRKGFHNKLKTFKRSFFYMPFMHSESLVIHKTALRLFNEPGMEDYFEYEIKHKEIIERFGRFPHRNQILGRDSTAEEIEFLSQPGSSF